MTFVINGKKYEMSNEEWMFHAEEVHVSKLLKNDRSEV